MKFNYELEIKSWSELWFFLFRRKLCPTCRGPLERLDVLPEQSEGWETERRGLSFKIDYAYSTKDRIKYRCPRCHAYYWLSDLVARQA